MSLNLFHYVIREIWLGNSEKFICIDQQDSKFSQTRKN